MNRNRAILILVFISLLGGLIYLVKAPTPETTSPQPSPTDTPPATTSTTPTPSAVDDPGQLETSVQPESPNKPGRRKERSIASTKPHSPPRKAKPATKPLMELVEEDSTLGDVTIDNDDEAPLTAPEIPEPVVTDRLDTIEDLMKDANLIVSGFQETDTDELSGVWSGTLSLGGHRTVPVFLNRIWDHMTDDYLPPSCFGFKKDNKIIAGYLRHNNLTFYEKTGHGRSKLIVRLQNKFVFEILSPQMGSRMTKGLAYEVRKKKLIPIGSLTLQKEQEATADMDCSYID